MQIFESPDAYRLQIYLSLLFVCCIIGIVASVLTILVIGRMLPMTSHVYLIFFMTLFQLIYDAAFFFKDGTTGYVGRSVANFLTIFAGISTSLISNWIAYAMFYTVVYRKKFDVITNLRVLHASYGVPSTIVGVLFLCVVFPQGHQHPLLKDIIVKYINNIIRFGSILLNFILILGTTLHVYYLYGKTGNRSPSDIAVSALCQRMVFYPIIQAIGRVGAAWYEIGYGLTYVPTHPSDVRYASMVFMAIICPLVSVGYLIVFLWMQPNAWNHLKSILMLESVSREDELSTQTNRANRSSTLSESNAIRQRYASTLEDGTLESMLSFCKHSDSFHSFSNNHSVILATEMLQKTVVDFQRVSTASSDCRGTATESIHTENPMRSISSSEP